MASKIPKVVLFVGAGLAIWAIYEILKSVLNSQSTQTLSSGGGTAPSSYYQSKANTAYEVTVTGTGGNSSTVGSPTSSGSVIVGEAPNQFGGYSPVTSTGQMLPQSVPGPSGSSYSSMNSGSSGGLVAPTGANATLINQINNSSPSVIGTGTGTIKATPSGYSNPIGGYVGPAPILNPIQTIGNIGNAIGQGLGSVGNFFGGLF